MKGSVHRTGDGLNTEWKPTLSAERGNATEASVNSSLSDSWYLIGFYEQAGQLSNPSMEKTARPVGNRFSRRFTRFA